MTIEQTLDKLPVWNKKIAQWLAPAEPYFDVMLLLTAALCIWAIFRLKPQYKGLLLAFIYSP